MLSQIPAQAAVAAQNNLSPHLSQRRWLFTLPETSRGEKEADFIAFDLQSNPLLYASTEAYCSHIDELLASPGYGLTFSAGGLLLFERGAPDAANVSPGSPCP